MKFKFIKNFKFRIVNYSKLGIVVALVTGIVLLLFSRLSSPARAAWWDDNWGYRQAVEITNAGSAVTNFQVAITMNTSTLITAGKMQSSCQDVRVTDINGTLLSHWIERGSAPCNTTTTNIWVKVPSISTTGTILYVYYGNSTAPSIASGYNVFDFFDDFSGAAVNGNIWTSQAGTWTVSAGTLTSNTAGSYLHAGNTTGSRVMQARLKASTVGTKIRFGLTNAACDCYPNAAGQDGVFMHLWDSPVNSLYEDSKVNGGGTQFQVGSYTNDTYNVYKIVYQAGTDAKFYQDTTLEKDINTNVTSAAIGPWIDQTYVNLVTVDWVLTRQFAATEPTTSLAAEEKGVAPIAYWKFDEGQGTTANDSTANGNVGTLTGAITALKPTWQVEDLCVTGKCLFFEGSSANTTVANTVNAIQTVSMWVKYASASGTIPLIKLTSAADVKITTGNTLTSDGLTGPTYYVNGVNTTTIAANKWNLVTVTMTAAVNANAIAVGLVGTTYLQGFVDEVKLYSYVRTAAQVQLDFNSKAAAAAKGSGTILGAQANDALSNGLVGYWKMEDNVSGNAKTLADSSGNGNSATTNNGANASGMDCTVPGKFGYGCHFDAVDDYVSVANSISGVNTVAFWASPSAQTVANFMDLNGSANISSASGTVTTTNITAAVIYVDGTPSATLKNAQRWQQVVVTTTTAISASAITMGKIGSNFYGGRLDEVRLYNRVLSPTEVAQLYNFAPGPVAYWPFEEGQGSTVNDKSGSASANTGTWNGTGATHWTVGQYGWGGNFNGSDDFVSAANAVANTGTVEFWVNPTSTTNNFVGLDASHYITASSGTLSATGFTGATIYVNGVVTSTIAANQWQHVAVTSTAPIASGTITLGKANNAFLTGKIDEVRIYNYARSQKQIIEDMNANHPAPGSPVGSLAGYWKFDEGGCATNPCTSTGAVHDSSPNGSGGTPVSFGGTFTPQFTDGKFGSAMWFRCSGNCGATDQGSYVDFANNPRALRITGGLTLSAWVNLTDTAHVHVILDKSGQPASVVEYRFYVDASGKLNMTISADGTSGSNLKTVTGSTVLSAGKWYYVAGVFTPSTSLAVYVNGLVDGQSTSSVPASLYDGTDDLRLGMEAGGAAQGFMNGMIDEAKVYAAALTPAQILLDYNHGSSAVFGSLSDTSGLTGGLVASNSASAQYCVPGDTTSCSPPVLEVNLEEGAGTSPIDTSTQNKLMTITAAFGSGYKSGKVGWGYNFIPPNGGAKICSNGTFTRPTTHTFEAWIYPRTVGTVNQGNVFVLGASSNGIAVDSLNGQPANTLNDFEGWSTGSVKVYSQVNSIKYNQWQHVAATYDGSAAGNRPILYINGIKQLKAGDNSNNSGSYTTTAANFCIGNGTGQGATFDGIIDQVKVYDYVRTPAQIKWDMDRGTPNLWWKFDECQGATVHNSSNAIMDQTTSGTITIGAAGTQTAVGDCNTAGTAWGAGKTGKYNYSLNLDGNDDYVAAANGTMIATDSATTTLASWGGWVKPTAAALGVIMHKDSEFKLTMDKNGKPSCGISSSGWQMATGSAALTASAWSHVLCTYDGTNIKVYVNGVNTGSAAQTGNITSTSLTALYAGKDPTGQDALLSGQVDEMKVWNYPLTAALVRNEFNQGSPVRFGPVTGAP